MNYKPAFSFFLFCGLWISTLAQTIVSGIVLDAADLKGLPFVNIGIKYQNIGTSSLKNGAFSIQIPPSHEQDTLLFSLVGYTEVYLPIASLIQHKQNNIKLAVKPIKLIPAIISSQRLTEQKFGIYSTGGMVHITDGSTNQEDIFEIAQLIQLDTVPTKITSINLHITEARKDSGIFRINFYAIEDNLPGKRIVEKNIVQTQAIKEGWLKFDLTEYNLYLKGDFIVAIEFIPNGKKSEQIFYEVKIGGSSKSFVRTSSQGEWFTPPHHYRLFITALVPSQHKQANDEEKETNPTKVLFSKFVRDSFSIFIQLPKNATKQKLPVIYLLDANVYFDMVANKMVENHSNAILVGIGYRDFITMDSLRQRDYTFPKADTSDSFSVSGGADQFLRFIQDELIPFIDQTYHTDPTKRMLMGHSLGGYFTLFALKESLQNDQNFFTHFIAASPSLDYKSNYINQQFQQLKNNPIGSPKVLLTTYGGREDSEDGGTGTAGMDLFNIFCDTIAASRSANIQLTKEIYPLFGHMETAIPTFYKALKETR